MVNIAIIGAGISGVTLAHFLKEIAEVTLFEKARGVSGRMSTRRADVYSFDHGAQYFTARTTRFQYFIQPLIEAGVIQRWTPQYVKFNGSKIVEHKNWADDEARYVGTPKMNMVAKQLAIGSNLHLSTRIQKIEKGSEWILIDDQDTVHDGFDWIISTAPAPQTVDLFPSEFSFYQEIKSTKMQACYALMIGLTKEPNIEYQAAHVENSDISWIALNSHKPGRSNMPALVVHSSQTYAEDNWDRDKNVVIQDLVRELNSITGIDVTDADHISLHGWKYANIEKRDKLNLLVDDSMKLAACGDWCEGGRVEGAFTSACKLADYLKEKLV